MPVIFCYAEVCFNNFSSKLQIVQLRKEDAFSLFLYYLIQFQSYPATIYILSIWCLRRRNLNNRLYFS